MSDATLDGTRAHIDAETLAAWAEQSLPAEAAIVVELHLSNCERCQEVLAAFARSEPAPLAAVVPFWSRRPVKWSTAGLAAAAAIVTIIWVGQPAQPVPQSTIARAPVETGTPLESRPAAPTPAPELREEKARPTPPARTQSVGRQAAAERSAAAVPAPTPAAGRTTVTTPPVSVSAAAPPVVSPAPPPSAQAPPPQIAQARVATAVTGSEASAVGAAKASVLEIFAPDPAAGLASRAAADAVRGAGRGGGSAFRATVAARWRVVAGLRIERSADAGKTWQAMTIKPALTTPIVAGMATSQFVCWFVGANGMVLVTNDGRTLHRVPVPEAVLLVSVIAEDGARAVVVTADGRKFQTLDGGLTWK